MKTKERGITLIALVVTIIVLLILAGVSIQMLTGETGILRMAREASDKTGKAEIEENVKRDILDSITENEGEFLDKSTLRGILVKYFKDVPLIEDEKWDNYPEGFNLETLDEKYTIDMAEVYNAGITDSGEKVTYVEDGAGNKIPVPKGFYYVGGTKDEGFVISDVLGDDLDNTKGGNQFVWVPCSGQNGEVIYQQDTKLWMEKYKGKQISYTLQGTGVEISPDKWKDEDGNPTSVQTYGGFYVGRCEAGLPNELSGIDNNRSYSNITINNDGDINNGRNITTYKPVSKKNNPSWNFINQKTSKTVSENMYEGNSYVTSQLIDGYAWDTIVEWMQTGPEAISDVMESKDYGNYQNSTISIPDNGLYATHIIGSTEGWLIASKYSTGPWTRKVVAERDEDINESNIDKYMAKNTLWKKYNENLSEFDREDFQFDTNTYRGYLEIATGASEDTKVKNIYDMAGNIWEWTTEISTNGRADGSNNPFAVLRGGSLSDLGSGCPLTSRDGNESSVSYVGPRVGFRVVLYIKQ